MRSLMLRKRVSSVTELWEMIKCVTFLLFNFHFRFSAYLSREGIYFGGTLSSRCIYSARRFGVLHDGRTYAMGVVQVPLLYLYAADSYGSK
jgi:hypothetical protein